MTHSVHPYAHRLGIIRDWKSRWFARPGNYQKQLRADVLLREFLDKRLRGYYVDVVTIERGEGTLTVTVRTSRPGMVIGRSGEHAAQLRRDILNYLTRIGAPAPAAFKLDIEEVKNPETRAAIVAFMIAEGLEKRLPFRRVAKQVMEKVMASRAVLGIKVELSGRLGGADMGRRELFKMGRVPLQTFRADVDFAREEAQLSYGTLGIKVWVYRGELFE